ncbi:MAG: oligosaccharide flippase family protein [Fidelibacterota bacterium]|nr:MAG: oligosaccharide flippase family protein [Candidatus Neomarinimicrobiota bacterium]
MSATRLKQWVGIFHHRLIQNLLALYGVHVASYLLPLITVPFLARVLGPKSWGLLAMTQAFAGYLIIIIEYGFNLAATRAVARDRDSKKALSDLLAGIIGAKLLLTGIAVVPLLVVRRWVVPFQSEPLLLWMGFLWAACRANGFLWYFQGLERVRLVANLDIIFKITATVCIFIFIRSPAHGWLVLCLYGSGAACTMLGALFIAYREPGIYLRLPGPRLVLKALRLGGTIFISRAAISLYTIGNSFILGLFAPVYIVGYYAGAEKIMRAFIGLLKPATQVFYPRLSHLVNTAFDKAVKVVRMGGVVVGSVGILIGVAILLSAPAVVQLILGPGYPQVVPVLQVMAFLVPLIFLNMLLGIHWMLPLGMDRQYTMIVIAAGLLNLSLAVILAPRFAQMGMAWALVSTESFVLLSFYILLRLRRLDPFSRPVIAPGRVCG